MVKTLKLALLLFICVLTACTKTQLAYLAFASAVTPSEVQVGQQIQSKVRLQFYTSSLTLDFLGFKSVPVSLNHFKVMALTKVTSHGETNINTAYWWHDTTYTFRPADKGQYVIDFSDDKQIFFSDTVIVR